ncbi:hypothetical protein PF010_g5398 [Phytophthora fragariae]|uniref:Uncharacterized protein n=1 Tax=Phytophthora fragariae TaxID=53985 RepID=A0A6G0LP21_9STRA|nr:hypothetical protein PF010_g5398 [Phytophthora fragariae]
MAISSRTCCVLIAAISSSSALIKKSRYLLRRDSLRFRGTRTPLARIGRPFWSSTRDVFCATFIP